MQPIEVKESEPIEALFAEYEAVKTVAAAVAEQNALVLKSLETMRGEMVASAENLTATFASLVDAIKGIQINVNVPEQTIPAPVVNFAPVLPEGKVPQVKLTMPKVKRTKEKINRKDGLADTAVVEYEYE